MKQLLLVTIITILSPMMSLAAGPVFCQGVTDTDKALLLFVREGKIVQVRIQTQGSLPKAFGARQIQSQGGVSLYTLSGLSSILEVETSALEGQGGWLNFDDEKFECEAN